MAAVSCCCSPPSSPRLANYATATYYIPRTPIPGSRGMRRMAAIDRSIDRSRMVSNSVARFWGRAAVKGTIPPSKFSIRPPRVSLGARARESSSRDHDDIPDIRSGGTRERRGTSGERALKFMRLLCDRIGCRRCTDCLVAPRRGSDRHGE